jgi:hypothetical protein
VVDSLSSSWLRAAILHSVCGVSCCPKTPSPLISGAISGSGQQTFCKKKGGIRKPEIAQSIDRLFLIAIASVPDTQNQQNLKCAMTVTALEMTSGAFWPYKMEFENG